MRPSTQSAAVIAGEEDARNSAILGFMFTIAFERSSPGPILD